VELLKQRLLLPPAPAEQVAKLVSDLGSDRFSVRQDATQALEKIGASAEGFLRKVLNEKLSVEVQQRINKILAKRDGEAIVRLRALEVLEQIGTLEARQLLDRLASDLPDPRSAQVAAAAAQRLSQRVKANGPLKSP
jgi:HEAT repeat protein